jgi:hypothetical protein
MAERFGPASAFKAMEKILENPQKDLLGRPDLLYSPQRIVDAAKLVAPVVPIVEDVTKALNAFTKGLVYYLSEEPLERQIRPMDGSQWNDGLSYLGSPEETSISHDLLESSQ